MNEWSCLFVGCIKIYIEVEDLDICHVNIEYRVCYYWSGDASFGISVQFLLLCVLNLTVLQFSHL